MSAKKGKKGQAVHTRYGRLKLTDSAEDVHANRHAGPRELAREWETYLESLRHSDELEAAVGEAVRAFWAELSATLAGTPTPPLAGPTDDRGFILVWDHGRHHFEVEFLPGETTEWFYRDRGNESFEGGEGPLTKVVEAARDYFNRVRAA